jgi:hypothetical protein
VPNGSKILNLGRLDNQFANSNHRKQFNSLSDSNKVFCTSLLKRSCSYLDQHFPGGNIVGFEHGKYNPSGWFNACMAVAASDRSTGCWLVNARLDNGRPYVPIGQG